MGRRDTILSLHERILRLIVRSVLYLGCIYISIKALELEHGEYLKLEVWKDNGK